MTQASCRSAAQLKPPVNNRFLPVLAALILGGFSCLSLLSYLKARDLMDRQITSSSLPLTSDAVVFRLQQILLKPMLASGLMGGNSLIAETIIKGETDPAQLQDYLNRMQQKTGATTTFLVSDQSRRYYHPSGILKRVSPQDPQDNWYFRFRASGKPIEINIDRDTADLSRITAFINVPLQTSSGRWVGATGLGLDVRSLQSQLQHYQQRYGARILLADRDGRILLASDQTQGNLRQVEGLAPLLERILRETSSTATIAQHGRHLYVRTNRIPEIGWTLVVIQKRTAEQSAFIDLLTQNLLAAVLISVVLMALAQLTLGREQHRLEALARTDQLSGLYNRSVFETLFAQLTVQCRQRRQPLAVALMDIDHFKTINDAHGHPVGDEVIRHVSRQLQSSAGASEPLFRWGGEEFLLLLPDCDLPEAERRLEAIRAGLRLQPCQLRSAGAQGAGDAATALTLPVTLSFGLTLHGEGETSTEVLQRADRALYQAKQEGRDRICTAQARSTQSA